MEDHRPYSLIRKEKRTVMNELVMKRNENRIGNLFKKKSVDSAATAANEVQVVGICVKPPFVVSEYALDAENIWCLHLVHSLQSSSHGFPEDV